MDKENSKIHEDIQLSLFNDDKNTIDALQNSNKKIYIDRPIYSAEDIYSLLENTDVKKESSGVNCFSKCSKENVGRFFCQRLPIISNLIGYKWKKYLFADIIAGLTMGIMHIPQGMGFALLAGLPPVYGLYVSFFPVIMYFFFTSSRSTSFGSQSLVCLMLGPILERECEDAGLCTANALLTSTTGNVSDNNLTNIRLINFTNFSEITPSINETLYIVGGKKIVQSVAVTYKLELAVLLALIIGSIQILLSIFQLGIISVYFSETFISACNAGAAFQIATTQVKFMLGLPLPPVAGRFQLIKTWVLIFSHIKETNIADSLVSLIALVTLILVKKLINENQKFKQKIKLPIPIEILVVIVSTAVAYFANLEQKFNLNVVGDIPQGIPAPSVPKLKHVKVQYVMDAFPIAIIGFLSAVLMAKLLGNKYDYKVDINQELLANGISNAVSSFFTCFPSSVAPPRTMLFDSVGGKSQIAFLFSSAFVLSVLLAIGHLFQTLPTSVLASVIVVALVPLFERLVDGRYLWHINKLDFLVWLGTLLSVIVLDLGIGIVIGVFLSILSVVLHVQKPDIYETQAFQQSDIFIDVKKLPKSSKQESRSNPNIVILKLDCLLCYANVDQFVKKVLSSVQEMLVNNCKENRTDKIVCNIKSDVESQVISLEDSDLAMIFDFSSVHYIDIVGLKVLKSLKRKLCNKQIKLVLVSCNFKILNLLNKFGLSSIVGEKNIYVSVKDAFADLSQ